MTLSPQGALNGALPLIQIAGGVVLHYRGVTWRKYPGLFGYLASEAALQGLRCAGVYLPPVAVVPLQLIARTVATVEVLQQARLTGFTREAVARSVGAAISGSALAAALSGPGLDAGQLQYLFRSYYLVALSSALLASVARRLYAPVLENPRRRVQRYGVAAWILVVTLAGLFVRGGLGYRVFAYERATWEAVDVLSYAALAVIIPALAFAMAATMPKKRTPAKVVVMAKREAA